MGSFLTKVSRVAGGLCLGVGLLLLGSCGSDGCVENRNSIPRAQFYSYGGQELALVVDSISIYGIGQPNDSMLLDSAVAVTQVYLPLRFTQDSTQYVIQYLQHSLSSPRYNDTLTFVYQAYPYFESIDCGAMYNFNIETCRYTRNVLDSVAVTVPEITNKDVESVRLFYTVQTTEPDEE